MSELAMEIKQEEEAVDYYDKQVKKGTLNHARLLAQIANLANIFQHNVFTLLVFGKVLPTSFIAVSGAICSPMICSVLLAMLQFHVRLGHGYLLYWFPNFVLLCLVAFGLRYDGFTQVPTDIIDIIVLLIPCNLFLAMPLFLAYTGTSKSPRCKSFFRRFHLFFISNSYLLFVIFLPDFVTVITGVGKTTLATGFNTICLVSSMVGLGLLRADMDNRLESGRTMAGFLMNPRFTFWIVCNMIYLAFNAVLYVFKLNKPELLDIYRLPFFVINLVLMSCMYCCWFFLLYKNWLFLDYNLLNEHEKLEMKVKKANSSGDSSSLDESKETPEDPLAVKVAMLEKQIQFLISNQTGGKVQ